MTRLPEQPGERIARDRVIRFSFDGKAVEAYEGDTVGSALYAAGQRTFSRSFKYHRRRGLLCCAGQCPNCLVAVDGAPGARACVEPVREGMRVEHLNARPSLDFDVMRATDIFGGPFTPPGFYYKTFIRPRRLWPLYEKFLRHAAGLGHLPKQQEDREWRTEYRRRHADVLITGGGVAGLSAAIAAAELGADVVLVDEGQAPGGQALAEGGAQRAGALVERAAAAGAEILSGASALGHFDGIAPVWQGDTLHQVRARRHVFATGAIEQPLVFAGNDLPGVMLSGGARRLVALYGVAPGSRAVIATTSTAGSMPRSRCTPRASRSRSSPTCAPTPGVAAAALAAQGIRVRPSSTVIEARGRRAVSAAVIGPLAGGAGGEETVPCDLVVVSGGAVPAISLALQAGAHERLRRGSRAFRAERRARWRAPGGRARGCRGRGGRRRLG